MTAFTSQHVAISFSTQQQRNEATARAIHSQMEPVMGKLTEVSSSSSDREMDSKSEENLKVYSVSELVRE